MTPKQVLRNNSTLEEKLKFLETFNLGLQKPFTTAELLSSSSREQFEEPGIELLLMSLGATEEKAPWRNRSARLWHFDTECIEDHGDYKRIAERMMEMSQGSLVLEDIQDYVDLDKEEAWLSFKHKGQQIKLNCDVDSDWVDPKILARFIDLLGESDPQKLYVSYDLGGQDVLIGCVTKDELRNLNAAGINFRPFSELFQ